MLQWFSQRGFGWIARRVYQEWISPKFRWTRALRRAWLRVGSASPGKGAAPSQAQTLYFFFDLQLCPLAFDIATYMAGAELERRRLGLRSVHVVFVPGHGDGLRLELPEYEAAVDAEARRWRLHNLVIPVTALLPACSGYTLCSSREQAEAVFRDSVTHVFPAEWQPGMPTAPLARTVRDAARAGQEVFPLLRATPQALRFADQFLSAHAGGRKPVVITLRQYGFTPGRNSNVDAWVAFADRMDTDQYLPVFLLDTDRSLDVLPEPLRRHVVLQAASWNVQLRMAIYERAHLNMAVVHGPMELCWYNEMCSYVLFCPVNTAPLTAENVLKTEGFEVGKQLPFARPWQRWVWGSDELDAIELEFGRILPELSKVNAS